MQMLYNSDSFAVMQFDVPTPAGELTRGGYEIVDKFARKDIFIEGALAESFKQGVAALADSESSADAFDDFIAGYTHMAQQPLMLH
jgi:hypothetical protein